MFTTGEAARILGVTAQTVINWVEAGTLQAVRVGTGRRRIPVAALARFVEAKGIPAEANAPDLWETLRASLPVRETSLPAVLASDANGVIVFWSDRTEELLGWSPQERIGTLLSDLVVRVPGLPVDLADLAREPGDELRLSLTLEFQNRSGSMVGTETTLSWIREASGRPIGTVFVLQPAAAESAPSTVRASPLRRRKGASPRRTEAP